MSPERLEEEALLSVRAEALRPRPVRGGCASAGRSRARANGAVVGVSVETGVERRRGRRVEGRDEPGSCAARWGVARRRVSRARSRSSGRAKTVVEAKYSAENARRSQIAAQSAHAVFCAVAFRRGCRDSANARSTNDLDRVFVNRARLSIRQNFGNRHATDFRHLRFARTTQRWCPGAIPRDADAAARASRAAASS